MSDEDTPEDDGISEDQRLEDELTLRRANEAKRLLEHPMIVEAFTMIEDALVSSWRGSSATDVDGREEAHRTLRVLDIVKNQLTSIWETGSLVNAARKERQQEQAAKDLESEREPRE